MADFNEPYPDEETVQAIRAARARWWTLQGDWYADYAQDLSGRLTRMGLGTGVFDGVLEVAMREGRAPLDLARLFDGYLGLDKEVRVQPSRFYRPRFTSVVDEETGKWREVQVPYTYRLGPGDPPAGDVSYNALRLARTEMAHMFHKGTVESGKNAPWLKAFQWMLSNTHAARLSKWSRPAPKGASRRLKKAVFRDICDTWAEQDIDELGPGRYRPDGSTLPLDHPNGLCTIVKITLSDEEWIDHLRRRRLQRLGVPYPEGQPLDKATYERLRDSVIQGWGDANKEPTPQVDEGGFPLNLDRLEAVRELGGTTGARLVRDPVTGRLFVQKRGSSPEHLREEVWTDAAYRALGVRVPEFRVYETQGGPVKLAAFIEGRTLQDLMRGGAKKKVQAALKKARKDFAADALLGNWDAVGLELDNLLVDEKGNVWRIDNGGGLRFRAQGRHKGGDWNGYPDELWTMRDARVNEAAARVFGELGFEEVVTQLKRLTRKRKALLGALPEELQEAMGQRLDVYRDVAKMAQTLSDDRWNWDYIDGFARHSVGIRQAGITARFPQKLTHSGVIVKDENDVMWDSLRGENSVIYEVSRYMNDNGGDFGIIEYWMGRQAGSSWSGASQAVKWYIAQQRGGDTAPYYWGSGADTAQGHYEGAVSKLGQQKYDDTLQMWHAFNYELVRNVPFQRNNRRGGYLELVRTEERAVLEHYGLAPGDEGTILRGACESASIFQTVVVAGDQLTRQRVPYHRVFGLYFYERTPGSRLSPFYGDRENEIVFIPDGIELDYVGWTQAGVSTSQFW